jgi:drug/metabolite transporter (DMT)-like permease
MPARDDASPDRSAGPMRRDMDVTGAALALLISIFWGISPVTVKLAFEDIAPIRLAVWRFGLGGVAIMGWAWFSGQLDAFRVKREEVRTLVVVGLILALQVGCINFGTKRTSAAHAAVILNSYAVHIVVLAHFLIPGDRLTLRRLSGILVAYAGILTLFVRQPEGAGVTLLGDLLVFASSILLAERTVYLARAVHRTDPLKLLMAQIVVGSACFIVYSALFEPGPTRWTARLVAILLFQGIVLAGFNFVINLWLLQRYRPSGLAAFYLTQPVFGVIAATLMAGDRLTPELIVASVAVTVGIALTGR